MNKTALITGITGQDGSFLAEFLLEKGYEVHGIMRRSSSFNTARIEHLYLDEWVRDMKQKRLIELHYGDMTDSSSLIRIIQTVQPDEIYNLAAQSHVKVSFDVPEYTAEADAVGTLRLLEAVRIDGVTIPRNTPLYGLATISGMRLQVTVSSVEYGGRIFAVEAVAYDLDGQPGLNVPNSRERTALKEALASVGQTAGTSVNVTRSAGQQVLSELARGGLQASSQYVAGKLREVKITLKANHQLLLISKQQ